MPQLTPETASVSWPDHEATLQHVAGHGAKILVVEDEHLVALDIRLRLTRMGFAPAVAFTGADAVLKASEEPYDLILMDVRLRGPMDGIEAARTIRGTHDVPIIYLTAYADEATVERARLTEPYGYLLKPFHDRELEATIQIALQRHASERLRSERQQLQRFLSEASAIMAESLDYQRVATGIADLLVPRYADWCLIHLAEIGDRVPAYTYARPEANGHQGLGGDARAVHEVEHQHSAKLLIEVDDSDRAATIFGSGYLPALREIGARSALCVPLVTRDIVLGSLSLVAGSKRPRYGINDLAFVEDVGHRLAMALDNALLYRTAEQAIRIRDDVLAIVSHDLRGPLATIMLRAEAIARDATVGHVGAAIMRSAHRMNRLIGDLLDASAINAGKLTLDVAEHEANEILHEACDMFRLQAEQRDVVLVEQAAEHGARVRCDRDRVLQVFANLLSNAIKFTQAGGAVTVAAKRNGAGLDLSVSDTGIGIAADQLPRLFDRFWQAQGRRDGAGLGLYIASGIVDAHGSALTVESVHGAGSTFSFALPLAAS